MKLSAKLIGGFSMVAGITLFTGIAGWRGVLQIASTMHHTAQLDAVAKNLLQREIDHLMWVQKAGAFLTDETITALSIEKDCHKCGFGTWYYSESRKQAEADIPEIAPLLSQIEEPHAKLHLSAVELETLLKKGSEGRKAAADFFKIQIGASLKQIQAHLANIRSKLQELSKTAAELAARQENRCAWASAGGMIVGTLAALVLGILIARRINALLNRICCVLSKGVEQTVSSAGQVALASQSLAEGASEQAASLEETSASLEEMSSMTKRSSEGARQAKHLTENTKFAAAAGAQGVQAMNRSMDRIQISSSEMRKAMGAVKESNSDVAKIIKAIDEIAFQTNILALNAAVEAARAGEAGMGFSVVADEVRNLAQKSAAAARETACKIEAAIGRTEAGALVCEKVAGDLMGLVEQSRQVNASLMDIEQKSKEVDALVEEMAVTSLEQSHGIEQISTAVSQMDKVTQSNSANAEEGAAAAAELNAQADSVNSAVEELKVLVHGTTSSANSHQTMLNANSALTKTASNASTHGSTAGKNQPVSTRSY